MARWKIAALALLGWYLMIAPPRAASVGFDPDFSAPLTDWVRLRLFDSASECQASKQDYARKPPETLPFMLDGMKDARATMNSAQCVATSDPRLKLR